ncbi:MAG: hypothetical protein O7D86_06025 [Proteobacteria bacterium]|nr:hypothetical protein [Pseudomonadota bacterium]
MSRVFKLAISIFLLLLACGQDKTVNPDGAGDLIGTLTMNGIPVAGASIQIDNILNWKATTDESGYFEIKNITLGEHTFKAYKQSGQNSYAQQESQVYINNGTNNFGEVRLPIPPKMYEIDTLTVTSNSVMLNWTPSYDPEFREYKIYRKYDPGIDESTGELIFVSTVPTDTSFNDTRFTSGFKNYYRAYVLSAFGKLGGSNVISVSTPEINYLPNGDF